MSRFNFITGFIIVLISLFFACADQIVSDCETADDKVPSSGTITFSDIQKNVFDVSCTLSGCHSGTSPVANLSLNAGQSYDNILNINSRQKPDLKLVLPGNSAQSYIIHKLNANNTSVMPPAGKLGPAVIDSVTAWIDSGAIQN